MKTEKEMREMKAPTPETVEELSQFVTECLKSVGERSTDEDMGDAYGRCVYAMSLAATASYNFIAKTLGVTGFQAGCADMDIIRRVRNIEGPFMLLVGEKLLYPQSCDFVGKVQEFQNDKDVQKWLKDEAVKLLDKNKDNEHVHPDVRNHWRKLAGELK